MSRGFFFQDLECFLRSAQKFLDKGKIVDSKAPVEFDLSKNILDFDELGLLSIGQPEFFTLLKIGPHITEK